MFHLRPFIITVTSLLIATMIGVLVIIPAIRDIRTLNERIHTQRKALEILYQRGQNIRTSSTEYENVKKDIPLITSSFLTLGDELEFITALEAAASTVGMQQVINLDTSQHLTSEGSPAESQSRRVLLRLDLEGSFSQLLLYVRELEAMHPYVNILSIYATHASRSTLSNTFSPDERTVPPAPLLKISLTAATYWRPSR
ncbi:MAG: hypothetical protein AB1352_01725 [Patescibacteria group bacterium]